MGSTNTVPPGFTTTDLWPFTQEEMTDFRMVHLRDAVALNAVPEVAVNDGGSGYTQGAAIVVQNDNTDSTGVGLAGYANVTDGEITSIKITNIGKLYTADPLIDVLGGTGADLSAVRASVKLSPYNKATGNQFFTDADINARLYALLIDQREDMMAAYYDKLNEGIYSPYPQDPTDAAAYARYEQIQICYRFLRADCRSAMLDDPGFQSAVPDQARKPLFDQWNKSIVKDGNWARGRTGGFASVQRVQK